MTHRATDARRHRRRERLGRSWTAHAPHGREEDWRFTPLARLRGLHDGDRGSRSRPGIEVDRAPEARHETVPAATLRSRPLAGAGRRARPRCACAPSAEDAVVVTVSRSEAVAEPPDPRRASPARARGSSSVAHVVIRAEAFAQGRRRRCEHTRHGAVLPTTSRSCSATAPSSPWSRCRTGTTTRVHLGRQHAASGGRARCATSSVTLGGDLVRLAPTVEYAGPGGDAELFGLYFADAGQHLEHRLLVDHAAPHCRTNVLLQGRAAGRPEAGSRHARTSGSATC